MWPWKKRYKLRVGHFTAKALPGGLVQLICTYKDGGGLQWKFNIKNAEAVADQLIKAAGESATMTPKVKL